MKKVLFLGTLLFLATLSTKVSAEEVVINDKRAVIYDMLEAKGIDTTVIKAMHAEVKAIVAEVDRDELKGLSVQARKELLASVREDVKKTRAAYLELHKEVLEAYRAEIKTKVELKIDAAREVVKEKVEATKETREAIKKEAIETYKKNVAERIKNRQEANEEETNTNDENAPVEGESN